MSDPWDEVRDKFWGTKVKLFDVVLTGYPEDNKMKIIKKYRELTKEVNGTYLHLKEVKIAVETENATLFSRIPQEKVDLVKKTLGEENATLEIVQRHEFHPSEESETTEEAPS